MAALDLALKRIEAVCGADAVNTDDDDLSAAATATYPSSPRVLAIVRPANTEQVAACLRIATEERVAMHAISRGRNWGYGSRSLRADAVLLDLRRLVGIRDYDEQLGTVTVEAGVTFAALFDFLRGVHAPWLGPSTSGPADGSVLGNALERGVGTGPHADRAAFLAGLEVVLPNGTIARTGHAGASGRTPGLSTAGVGPSLDGLFFQSNLGVVTRATVWLAPRPEHLSVAFFRLEAPGALPALLDTLRRAALARVAPLPASLFNDLRLLSVVGAPEGLQAAPLGAEPRATLRRAYEVSAWAGDVGFHAASRAHARCLVEHFTEAIRPRVDGIDVLEAERDQLDALLAAPDAHHAWIGAPLRHALLRRHVGVPQSATLRQAYWRKQSAPPPGADLDLDRDRCGLLWVCPLVPFLGDDVARAVALWEDLANAHGFDAALSLQALSSRCVHLIGTLMWDRDRDGDDQRALRAGAAIAARLHEAGYPAYRWSTAIKHGESIDPGAERALARIKAAFDPAQILS